MLEKYVSTGFRVVENPIYRFNDKKMLEALTRFGAKIQRKQVDFTEYDHWMKMIDYETNYPQYVKQYPSNDTLPRKSFQHFLSIQLLKPKNGDTVIDIGSSASVFIDILKKHHPARQIFRQDLTYRLGLNGEFIGGNASELPLGDNTVDKIFLHCAWEHFEGDSDVDFLTEAGRVLKPGGMICIIPLYLADKYIIYTSPSVWKTKYTGCSQPPIFDIAAIIGVNETKKQRYERYYDCNTLFDRVVYPFAFLFDIKIVFFYNHSVRKGCTSLALIAEKKTIL